MNLIKQIGAKLTLLSIIFALNVIIPAEASILNATVQPLGEDFSRDLDDSIADLREHSGALDSFVDKAVSPIFKELVQDPVFMARVKASNNLDTFKHYMLRDLFSGREEKLRKLKEVAMTVSKEVKRYIHRYDDLDRDGHEFAASGQNWSFKVWYHNQAYTRTPYFAMIKDVLNKQVVWSAKGESAITWEMLLLRIPEADLTFDEKALINSNHAINKNVALQIEPVAAEEFKEILRYPKIPYLIESLQFASGPLAVLVPRSEEITTLILLRPRSYVDSWGDATGERVLDRVKLYKIDFVGGVDIKPFMHIGYKQKSTPRLFLEPEPTPCSRYVANEWAIF